MSLLIKIKNNLYLALFVLSIFIFAASLALFISSNIILKNDIQAVAKLQTQVAQTTRELEKLSSLLANKNLRYSVDRLSSYILSEDELLDFVDELAKNMQEITQESDLLSSNLQKNNESFNKLAIKIQAKSDFDNLMGLIKRMQALSYLSYLKSVSISAADQNSYTLTADLIFYVKNSI